MTLSSLKSKALLLAPCALMVAMVGCVTSTDQIASHVKDSMQSTFDTSPDYAPVHLKVGEVHVVKKTDGTYAGIAGITAHGGTEHQVPLLITMTGSNLDWKIEPGGLEFAHPAGTAVIIAPVP